MPLVAAGLFPHPPVMIPEIGGEDSSKVRKTIETVKTAMEQIVAEKPDTVVVMSPHNLCFSDGPSLLMAEELCGNMGAFGHPDLSMALPVDQELGTLISQKAAPLYHWHQVDKAEAARYKKPLQIDWGSFVPLYYLLQAGFQGKLVLLTPDSTKGEASYALGAIVSYAAQKLNRRVALIATGDLSHKLTPDAPHGYSPKGNDFDEIIVNALSHRNKESLDQLSSSLLQEIDTCGLPSVYFLLGALGNTPTKQPLLSHEGPFGVGYGVALYVPEGLVSKEEPIPSPYVALARDAIEHYIRTGRFLRVPQELPPDLRRPGAVRITLREFGAIRGYAYTVHPQYHSLAEEIIHVAKAAATENPPHPPVTASELEDLDIEVETTGFSDPN